MAAQLFGHTHSDEFRLLPKPAEATGPILFSGAFGYSATDLYPELAAGMLEGDSSRSCPVVNLAADLLNDAQYWDKFFELIQVSSSQLLEQPVMPWK